MELARSLEALLHERVDAAGPGMAIRVERDGELLLRAARGMAQLELGVPLDPAQTFRIGSLTKQFTATAILRLAREGRLELDAPLERYLPDYPPPAHPVTVEHLLTHTSGIPDHPPMPQVFWQTRRNVSVVDLIASFRELPLLFEPGSDWAYGGGSAYFLLGAIVEALSGLPWERFVEERIFAPLDMNHSAFDRAWRVIPGRVAGYQRGRRGVRNARFVSMSQYYAGGGLLSSVDDLARWQHALDAGELLSPELWQRATTPFRLRDGRSTRYGYGLALPGFAGEGTLEHGGGTAGFAAYALAVPAERLHVVVLSNCEGGHAVNLALELAHAVLGRGLHRPEEVPLEASALAARAGRYGRPGLPPVLLTLDAEGLRYEAAGTRLRLHPSSPTAMFADEFPPEVGRSAFPHPTSSCSPNALARRFSSSEGRPKLATRGGSEHPGEPLPGRLSRTRHGLSCCPVRAGGAAGRMGASA